MPTVLGASSSNSSSNIVPQTHNRNGNFGRGKAPNSLSMAPTN
jgi:hypothetical protein